jgi:cytochrome c-type biogenesis protein CcmH
MPRNIRHVVLFIVIVSTRLLYAADTTAIVAEMRETRLQALTHEVRCVVCQGQSIAESDAPLAENLRHKIQSMLLENKSDAEIKQYLAARYGEFILLKPRWSKATAGLWLAPFLFLLIASAALFRLQRSATGR